MSNKIIRLWWKFKNFLKRFKCLFTGFRCSRCKCHESYVSTADKEWVKYIRSLDKVSGCYHFASASDKDGIIHEYIGTSTDLSSRPLSSFKKHVNDIDKDVTCTLYFTETDADAYLLEVYLINILKPKRNKMLKARDELTFGISYNPVPITKVCKNANGGN